MNVSVMVNKYPRQSWYFVGASLINSLGSSFMWPLTTLYVHNVLGRSYGEAGLVLLCQSVASIIGQVAGGALYYRIGAKHLIVGALMSGAIAQISLIGVSGWYWYIGTMMAIGFLNAISMPAIQAYMGFRWKEQRRELFNLIYVGNNVGMAIGTSIAGLLAGLFSFTANFLANGLATLAFACFCCIFMTSDSQVQKSSLQAIAGKTAYEKSAWQLLLNVKLYLFMAIGSMLIWFSTSVWNSGIAPHLDEQGSGMAAYSLLWTINGIIILAGQPLLSLMKKFISKSLPEQLIASSICYAAGFALILLSQSYGMMVAGMVITTFGEMLIAPTVPAFITEKAGKYSPFYLGIVGSIGTVGRLSGPFMLGTLYDRDGVRNVLLMAAAAAFIAILLFGIHASFHRDSGQMQSHAPAKAEAAI
ncbi:hypothetical protein SD71_07460 [Cohnella kolymensis]|uniref:Major facilitator superfamily (MFS) profile domain-containing protein n=1 Tax=Cohnella kolymensis TaxID=1590652 RepID=A0ABR5A6P9_9BACL|nr:MFS transporter [Cohnella kolymensis]KIL36443.1 hypothetical protein SD71_07460 [Cohnella kolymensis]